jgi:hypothetical protein
MTSNPAAKIASNIDSAEYPPGFLDEPLPPSEAAAVAKKTKNALAVDRCRESGIPYSKAGGKITYTRRDIYEYNRQNRRIPQNNPKNVNAPVQR